MLVVLFAVTAVVNLNVFLENTKFNPKFIKTKLTFYFPNFPNLFLDIPNNMENRALSLFGLCVYLMKESK